MKKITLACLFLILISSTTIVNKAKADCDTVVTSAIRGEQYACKNDSGKIYSVAKITGHIYNWNVLGGKIISGQGTDSISVRWDSVGGIRNIQIIQTDTACKKSGSPVNLTVYVNPAPVLVSIKSNPPDSQICVGTKATFTATVVNGGLSPIYQWKLNEKNVGTNNKNFTIDTLSTSDRIICSVQSNAICVDTLNSISSDTIIISVKPSVTASLEISTNSTTVCDGSNIIFTTKPANGGSSPKFQWRLDGSPIGTDTAVLITKIPLSNHVVRCEMIPNAACVTNKSAASNRLLMKVNPNLTVKNVVKSSVDTVCFGTPISFTASPINGGASPKYQWMRNGVNVGLNKQVYSFSKLTNHDTIVCILTSSVACGINNPDTSDALIMTIYPTGRWLGVADTNWFNADNWCGGVPNKNTPVLIPAGVPRIATVPDNGNPNGAVCHSFTIDSGATFMMKGASYLIVGGDWTNNGTFISSGLINFNGNTTIKGKSVNIFTSILVYGKLTAPDTNMVIMADFGGSGGFEAGNGTVVFDGNSSILGINNTFNNLKITGKFSGSENPINIMGNFINDGNFNCNNGTTIRFSGIKEQFISGKNVTDFCNITITNKSDSGVKLGSNHNLLNTIVFEDSGRFNSNKKTFTLISTKNATARVAPLPQSAVIKGKINVQRYVTGGKTGWAFLASPIANATLNEWKKDNDFPVTVTGSFLSVQKFDEKKSHSHDSGLVNITSLNDTLIAGKGFKTYIGDGVITTNPLTFDIEGMPNRDTISLPVSYTNPNNKFNYQDGWNLVANPYPSAIDWDNDTNWIKENIQGAIYVYNADNNQYSSYAAGVSNPDTGAAGGVNNIVPSSQGFMVRAKGEPTLKITENAKTTGHPTFRGSSDKGKILRLILNSVSKEYHDETVIRFHKDASFNFDDDLDAYKLFGYDSLTPSIFSKMSDISYSINSVPELKADYIIPIRVKAGFAGFYTVSTPSFAALPSTSCIIFEDTKSKVRTDLRISPAQFNIGIDTIDNPRFNLKFSLPVQAKFTAVSTDTVAGTFAFTNKSTLAGSYEWDFGDTTAVSTEQNPTHSYAKTGDYTVRLVAISSKCTIGDTAYLSLYATNTVGINEMEIRKNISVINNQNGAFLKFNFDNNANAIINVYNILGQKTNPEISINARNQTVPLNLPNTSSMYFINVIIENNNFTYKIVR